VIYSRQPARTWAVAAEDIGVVRYQATAGEHTAVWNDLVHALVLLYVQQIL
jgi:hypothetical protein